MIITSKPPVVLKAPGFYGLPSNISTLSRTAGTQSRSKEPVDSIPMAPGTLQSGRGMSPSAWDTIRFGYDTDLKRFHDLIKGKQRKEDIFKYISQREMKVDKDGKIRFPMPRIDQPNFRRDDSQNGEGQGMGPGEVGDEVQPGDGDGEEGNQPGDEKGDHSKEQWGPPYSPSEIAKMIGDDLKLPNLQPKSKGQMREVKITWNSMQPYPPGRILPRPTIIKALKREAAQAKHRGEEFDPREIQILEPDFQRLSWKQKMKPSSKTVIIYMMDVSGSVTDNMKEWARTNNFVLSTWLKYQYGMLNARLAKRQYNDKEFFGRGVDERFIIHDTEAAIVPEEDFYTTRQSGGTAISSAFEQARDLITKQYPPEQWNVYLFYYGDGDNMYNDNDKALGVINELMKMKINLLGYVHLHSPYSLSSSNFMTLLSEKYGKNHNQVRLANLGSEGDGFDMYRKTLRPLLEERKAGGKKK